MSMHGIDKACAWGDSQVLSDGLLRARLGEETVQVIHASNETDYLNILARALLSPGLTDELFILYEPLVPELVCRAYNWTTAADIEGSIEALACSARILPTAPCLEGPLRDFLTKCKQGFIGRLGEAGSLLLLGLEVDLLRSLLSALLRLYTHDVDQFNGMVSPVHFCSLLRHQDISIRYLAVRCLALGMKLADAMTEKMISVHTVEVALPVEIEGISLPPALFSLREEQRWQNISSRLESARNSREQSSPSGRRSVSSGALSPQIANIAGTLLPRAPGLEEQSVLVTTPTVTHNLAGLAKALLDANGILLSGPLGSGKTLLVTEAAKLLNKSRSMATLHLNEQTDAKSLLGIYTTSPTNGSFVWQPGILVQSMREGRWMLIEDIHKASPEVTGILLPVIEHGEIFIPGRNEKIRAATGFCVIATTTETLLTKASATERLRTRLNLRLWKVVEVEPPQWSEIEHVLSTLFALIRPYLSSFFTAHRQIESLFRHANSFKSSRSRPPTSQDLFKWCGRSHSRLKAVGCRNGSEPIEEIVVDEILQDGIFLYAGHHSTEEQHIAIAKCIAEAMQISLQRMFYRVYTETPSLSETDRKLGVGRGSCTIVTSRVRSKNGRNSNLRPRFALTRGTLRTMEEIVTSVQYREPILLVGETGVGKTAVVQHLATMTGQKLTVVNLSQQSESGDLFGGMKPITTRSLAVPMLDTFETLFDHTFSTQKNAQFLASTRKCVSRSNWTRLMSLLEEAVDMAKIAIGIQGSSSVDLAHLQPNKRRKLYSPKYQSLRHRWKTFEKALSDLQAQASHGERSFAFAFVEGKIVQALRNGDWVLLDELNLATPETLQSITSLLSSQYENTPSLLLHDAKSMERVQGHPSFRLFAAMNPATDTGKRELPLGIRTKFSEVFVQPSDTSLADLTLLISTYLVGLLDSDERAGLDLATCYLDLQRLNHEKTLTDGAGQIPHFSLRSLVRTLIYVNENTPRYGLRRAIYEGFLMSFATMLSSASNDIVVVLTERHLFGGSKKARAVLRQSPRMKPEEGSFILFEQHFVWKGELAPESQPNYIITPCVRRNLLNLARAVAVRRFPVLLQGPTSSGKTSMLEYLAKISGNKFVRVNNHEHTDLQEYLGSYASGEDGRLTYTDGVLVQALRQGHWIVLDELNLAPSDVLEALNRLLDDNRELFIPETQEVVKPHPNFVLFATQNPAGLYGGRKHLSRAFRNRFLELQFDDIPEDELEWILRERSQIAPSFCARIVSVYKRLSMLRQSSRLFEQRNGFATLRDLFRWASRPADDRHQLAINGYMLLAERVRDPVEKASVKCIIEETMKVEIAETDIYSLHSRNLPLRGPLGLTLTPATRRLLVLVSKALENNEPVLLVGDTGCGKTQVCQTIASIYGQNLHMVNAHSNTETGDLVGAQRPLRNKVETEQQLRQSLETILASKTSRSSSIVSLEELMRDFEKAEVSFEKSSLIDNIKTSIAHARSLFEWADGCLITAMKRGEHFLLDEISLAEDSVLERLNSVLEPGRSIFLAEKGVGDSFVRAAPGFQFLATMNPGGDYGKRELSSALRNRLTEIWVPALSDQSDLLPIVQARLDPVPPDTAEILVCFAKWFQSTFHKVGNAGTSLRDLLTWADFVRANSQLDTKTSIVHGAALVFVDSIGASPTSLTCVNVIDVQQARRSCLQELDTTLHNDPSSIYFENPPITTGAGFIQCGDFGISFGEYEQLAPNFVFDAPTTRKNLLRVLRGLQLSRPILLEGDPGVGKTALIEALAKLARKRITRINLSDQTDLMDLFGSDVPVEGESAGIFSWRDGPLLQALQRGDWVLLDEMNLATQSVLEGLNSCFDHREQVYVSELDRSFARHPKFVLFATQNPHHQGGGRKGLPASFVNRFTVVYTEPLNKEDLFDICRRKYSRIDDSILQTVISTVADCQAVIQQDQSFQSNGGPWELNLRDIGRWLDLYADYKGGVGPAHFFDAVVSHRFRTSEQLKVVQDVYDIHLPEKVNRGSYSTLSTSFFQAGIAYLSRDPCQQAVAATYTRMSPHLLPQAESLIHCINKKWPAIIVGESGSGKSSLVRMLASLRGARLVEFAVTEDVDTTDFIGGFEQYHQGRGISDMIGNIRQTCLAYLSEELVRIRPDQDRDILLEIYAICGKEVVDINRLQTLIVPLSGRLSRLIQSASKLELLASQQSQTLKARFVWNDGVLVEAVQNGYWLVLDNANTCNSAVLDRLNALLEPEGYLIISEQHDSQGNPRLVKPHDNFRVFFTVDPRRGELSRAMRNRSMEIHLATAPDPHVPIFQAMAYPTEAAIINFRRLATVPLSLYEKPLQIALAAVAVDHISSHDLIRVLPENFRSIGQIHPAVIDEMTSRCKLPAILFEAIRDFQERLIRSHPAVKGSIEHWPVDAEYSPPAILLMGNYEIHAVASRLSWLLCSFRDLRRLQELLSVTELDVPESDLARMDLLEGSLVTKRLSYVTQPGGKHFTKTLRSFISGFHEALATLPTRLHDRDWPVVQASAALLYLHDAVDIVKRSYLPAGYLSVYLETGHQIVSEFTLAFPPSIQSLQHSIAEFGEQEKLYSGQSLPRLWNRWRPAAAASSEQFNTLLRLDGVIATIDSYPHKARLARVLVNIQSRLLAIRTAVLEDSAQAEPLLEDIETTISNSVLHKSNSDASPTHFAHAFELLCQYQDLATCKDWEPKDLGHKERYRLSSLLAGRSTKTLISLGEPRPGSGALALMASFAGGRDCYGRVLIWQGTFGENILSKIAGCSEKPIRDVDNLTEETTWLSTIISHNTKHLSEAPLQVIAQEVYKLIVDLVMCHQDMLKAQFRSFPRYSEVISANAASPLEEFRDREIFVEEIPENHYFREVWGKFLLPALLTIGSLTDRNDFRRIGACLVSFALASIRLWIPSRPKDPAIELTIQRDRYYRRQRELETKLRALKIYESTFFGQRSHQKIRNIEHSLQSLGLEPPALPVTRPSEENLLQVHAEFCNVLDSIVRKHPETILLSSVAGPFQDERVSCAERLRENELLRQNLDHLTLRLARTAPEYHDLTLPATRLLQILDLGCSILHWDEETSRRKLQQTSASTRPNYTPLLGATPASFSESATEDLHEGDTSIAALRYLEVVSSLKLTLPDDSFGSAVLSRGLVAFESCYAKWKTHLQRDQIKETQKARYYGYRRSSMSDEENESREMDELFPSFTDELEAGESDNEKKNYDSKAFALKIADLHTALLPGSQPDWPMERRLSDILKSMASFSPVNAEEAVTSPVTMLPTILLLLDEKSRFLRGKQICAKHNIYKDCDIREARKLLELVHRLEIRMELIHQKWPEHATPTEILRCCAQVGQSNIGDSIAQLLSKAEKLHSLLDEWQRVASKEYSAVSLVDELASLIVEWRKLELSSWSGLLDEEDLRVDKDVKSWWFIMYEAVIHIPCVLLRNEGNSTDHAQGLVQTLISFLRTAGLGHFSRRLQLLRRFHELTQTLTRRESSLTTMNSVLCNVIQHFERFDPSVQKLFLEGKGKLVQEIEGQIKLASWKDTNVASLRESARRSHYRLFKIVKRYRAMMGQAIQSFVAQDPLPLRKELRPIAVLADPTETTNLSAALQVVEQRVQQWQKVPRRFREPLGSSTGIVSLYKASHNGLNVGSQLDAYVLSLIAAVSELRSETPSEFCEDNKALLLHLKGRKRRLLAEVLGHVRHMGIRRNLNTHELKRQSSLESILCTVSDIHQYESSSPECNMSRYIANAQHHFHGFLGLLEQARKSHQEHSEDLTSSEIGRCIGSLEGILLLMQNQRCSMKQSLDQLTSLRRVCMIFGNLRTQGFIALDQPTVQKQIQIKRAITSLAQILPAACDVLDIQIRCGPRDLTAIAEGLSLYREKLQNAAADMKRVFSEAFPHHIQSPKVHAKFRPWQELISSFRKDLEAWAADEPDAEYLMSQLLPWTDWGSISGGDLLPHRGDSVTSLGSFTDKLLAVIDKIFVGMQSFSETARRLPDTMEDGGWLGRTDQGLFACIRSLHSDEIATDLEDVSNIIAQVAPDDIETAVALSIVCDPVIQQFHKICEHVVERFTDLHGEVCQMSHLFIRLFDRLASEGFCGPKDADSIAQETSDHLDQGTGLGEGEGSEDISKDVANDEDLSELKQEQSTEESKAEIEKEGDAVDMGPDDLEGKLDDCGEAEDDANSGQDTESSTSGEDIEEETGSVDNLDPSAVDEKLWDGLADENNKDLDNKEGAGRSTKDRAAAQQGQKDDQAGDPEDVIDDSEDEGGSRNDGSDHPQNEKADAENQNEDVLELPDEMQLDGNQNAKEDSLSDNDMDQLSDVAGDEKLDNREDYIEEVDCMDGLNDEDFREDGASDAEEPEKHHGEDNDGQENELTKEDQYQTRQNEDGEAAEDIVGTDGGAYSHKPDDSNREEVRKPRGSPARSPPAHEQEHDSTEGGLQPGTLNESRNEAGEVAGDSESPDAEAFKKLGDVLDTWHRRRREILQASEARTENSALDIGDADFEHIKDEEDQGNAQALGTATTEQSRGLDEKRAVEDPDTQEAGDDLTADIEPDDGMPSPRPDEAQTKIEQGQPSLREAEQSSFVANGNPNPIGERHVNGANAVEEVDEVDSQLFSANLTTSNETCLTSPGKAADIWSHYSALTHPLSLILTEQLRLILSPTQATKLRGDFRTGKRLNLKRIIPYIASQYKRDKIWMRRSVPSKRNYQIMIAVDDSKSMMEGGAYALAFETLALLCKSLSMLEVGEFCVVGFGNEDHVRIAHGFGMPFTNNSGLTLYQHFSFQQQGTNVRKLIQDSTILFREARARSTSHSSSADLWQLQLIISDGICEDHEVIRRLVRQATEERIMIVFVVVDSNTVKGHSILDLTQAVFEPEDNPISPGDDDNKERGGGGGEMKLKMKRYLDGFPFPYYIVVRQVADLPDVLATALKSWFSEVVDMS